MLDRFDSNALLPYRRVFIILVHTALWTLSFVAAFLLRFDFAVSPTFVKLAYTTLPIVLVCRIAAFLFFKMFQGLWRYTGSRDLIGILKATTLSTVVFAAVLSVTHTSFPRSIIFIEWLGAVFAVGGVRFAIRALREVAVTVNTQNGSRRNVLIVGAGDQGEMLLREIQKNQAGRYRVVGFVDDDRGKRGVHIHGITVLGGIDTVPSLVEKHEVDELILAIPTATGKQMRRIVEICKPCGAQMRTMPGIDHLIDGRVTINQLRDVAIEDLLGREPVDLDMEALSAELEGKVVLVTGAGGSIGSEMCRQIARFSPSRLLLCEQAENNLFFIHRELQSAHPDLVLEPVIVDICDRTRVEAVFAEHRPQAVFHAAAHKHVPMMEKNPGEALKNNVFGTKKLADAADKFEARSFVMISTDKAVNPTSVMGASKRAAEIYIQALSQRSDTRFVTVRFGNVLGSSGSVIPIFREQIARGGPVTVTHPEMKRYFMTIPEASQLVLQAGTMGEGGEIFVLDMGEPVKIVDLARDLVTLSGLVPGEDIEIEFCGMRPGEKLFEELMIKGENVDDTRHAKIFVGRFKPYGWDDVIAGLDGLAAVTGEGSEAVRGALGALIPEYSGAPPATKSPARDDADEAPTADVIPLRR